MTGSGLSCFRPPLVCVIQLLVALAAFSVVNAQDDAAYTILIKAQKVACKANEAIAAGYSSKNWKNVSDVVDAVTGSNVMVYPRNAAAICFKVSGLSDKEKVQIQPYLTMVATGESKFLVFHADPRPAVPAAP